ncbi:hypothetical protein EDD17DRAFT_344379 [Pisolithus thermaeus]|nr:hypothetical protein EV401DRAFT_1405522 [Pisolithus croceorrhizus]KAI6164398.1 hypothetical protein EDD17DRAFT_344379 [Pisolithus thermaeus]
MRVSVADQNRTEGHPRLVHSVHRCTQIFAFSTSCGGVLLTVKELCSKFVNYMEGGKLHGHLGKLHHVLALGATFQILPISPLTVASYFPRARTSFTSSPFPVVMFCVVFLPATATRCSYRTNQDGQLHSDAIRHGQLGVVPNHRLIDVILSHLACPIRCRRRPLCSI